MDSLELVAIKYSHNTKIRKTCNVPIHWSLKLTKIANNIELTIVSY